MMTWIALRADVTEEHLGILPSFLDPNDPRSAREQLDANYGHGGGWCPFPGFKLLANYNLVYPGDPPTKPMARTRIRDELIILYEHEWVAIIQPDLSFEVCRID